jgi:two-component system, LytTR family, sensor kinase
MRSESSPSGTARPRPWLWWVVFFGFWTAFGILLATPQLLLQDAQAAVPWVRVLRISLLDMYSWALVALVAIRLPRWVSLTRERWPRAVGALLVAGVVLLFVRFFGAQGLAHSLEWSRRTPTAALFLQILPWNLLFYSGLLGLGYGIDYYRRYRDRELEASRLALQASVLQAQLAQAQLDTLKMQLHPHFLFNTLNAISALVRRDPDGAERMIMHLGDLLRAALAKPDRHEVTLREEMEILEPYLEIEKRRFGDRLQVDVAVDPDVLEARVPHLILQPLVENAIRHGVAPRQGRGRVEIRARRENGSLRVWIRDDGGGIAAGAAQEGGVGLENSRARIEHLYGAAGGLRIGNHAGGGAEVELSIPFREAANRASRPALRPPPIPVGPSAGTEE